MIYRDFKGKKLGMLGFGAMRMPTLEDGSIDEAQVRDMVRCAMENGVNYFDTAYPYHAGESERVIGRVLSEYPRDSWYLATKYPGHQILSDGYDPSVIFEEQLEKCGVEYFDFYLLHNVYENSIPVYMDPQWGILEYFREQKRLGRIKHLGFSTHARTETLREFLDICGDDMEFCQIQLNYLDWTLQDAKGKYDLLTERGIPVFVMEPVRGGRLAALSAEDEAMLRGIEPDASVASWAFRFLQGLPNVSLILSGMSDMSQMKDNIKTFSQEKHLTESENEMLFGIAKSMMELVPCTACRYCCDGCPMGLDIPMMIATCNELRYSPSVNSAMRIEFIDDSKKPTACIGCGACSQICPQGIDIPAVLRELSERLDSQPKWADICRQREAEAKAAQNS